MPATPHATPRALLLRDPAQIFDGWRLRAGESVLITGDRISAVGTTADLLALPACQEDAPQIVDCAGKMLMPALIDCHTHLIHAGTRLGDFLRREQGESYAALLEGGGGIHTTVAQTRAASDEELRGLCAARLLRLRAQGAGTVEIKGGYGLDAWHEARLLRLAREAGRIAGVRVLTTFLGAHALPPGRDRAGYVAEVTGAQLTAARPHADFIDVYCDRGAFTLSEAEQILRAGISAGLTARIHAEQVSHTGAAALAARLGASSADHLERIDDAGIAAMAAAGTVAVLLPGAMLYLHDPPPPVDRLRAAGVPMAISTDFNPGSSPLPDLWAAATLGVLCMRLRPEEALAAITRCAADALRRPDLGRISPGAAADLALFSPPPGERPDLRALIQHLGGHRADALILGGRPADPPPTGHILS